MAFLLQHLLTETAARLPGKEALKYKEQSLTYGELDHQTNQVARVLWEQGVQRGDRVGIFVRKSLASVISIFGILKAGGIYVPLDPGAPAPRLAYIARNCDLRVVLTSTEKLADLHSVLAQETPVEVLILTDGPLDEADRLPEPLRLVCWDEVKRHDDARVPSVGSIETDLAYLLYTSGSTGEPKGVMISHHTIFTFINWCAEKFAMNEEDRVTSHAPIHFDLSTFDIFVTIKTGGTVVLVPETHSVFPIELVRLLQKERVTVIYMVPSILSLMVNYGKLDSHDLSALRTILFAGEVFPIKYLRRLVELLPDADYYNLYGPTETNVCTYYQVQPRDLEAHLTQPVPIGIACENIEVFAVQENGELVTEPGQEGELWARGSCVAQGYWADPEKTAKGFVVNRFQPHYREVAYRTGDVVTLHEDRVNWVYGGRKDHMVKSRGYRIELGEIETALYALKGVKEAVVVPIPDDLVGNRLKAFVVPTHQNGLSEKDVDAYCRSRLPRYMVPETVEFLEILPKTSTGKVDRTSLARGR